MEKVTPIGACHGEMQNGRIKPFHRSGAYKRYSGKSVGVLAAADIFQEPHAYRICQQLDRHNLDMGELELRKPYAT